MKAKCLEESFSLHISDNWWKRLWETKISAKVKNFMWRAFHECIPSRVNLNKKGIELLPLCPECRLTLETTDHVLSRPKNFKLLWPALITKSNVIADFNNNIQDRLISLAEVLSTQEFEVMCVTSWAIWNHRNAWCHSSPVSIVARYHERVDLILPGRNCVWQLKPEGRDRPYAKTGVNPVTWSPPCAGWIKINVCLPNFLVLLYLPWSVVGMLHLWPTICRWLTSAVGNEARPPNIRSKYRVPDYVLRHLPAEGERIDIRPSMWVSFYPKMFWNGAPVFPLCPVFPIFHRSHAGTAYP